LRKQFRYRKKAFNSAAEGNVRKNALPFQAVTVVLLSPEAGKVDMKKE
jgi:hypothetical protein